MAADIHDIRDAGMFNREEAYATLRDEMGALLGRRDYWRDYDVQDHKNKEAIVKAELEAVVFHAKRVVWVNGGRSGDEQIDKVVAAVTKATIATARRMKREEELSRFEQQIKDLKRKADKAGIEFPPDWEV